MKTEEEKKQRRRVLDKEWRKKNREKSAEWNKDYYNNNRERLLQKQFLTRFGGLRDFILERDNWQCVQCGMTQEQHIVIFGCSITIDHIDGNGYYSKNPNNSPENLQTLCLRCHGKKDRKRQTEEKSK